MSNELEVQNKGTALDFGEFAGLGKEEVRPEDLSTSYLKVLQAGSKQEQEIDIAKAGDIYNNVTGEVYPASMVAEKPGIVFCPVKIITMYVENIPYDNGGGYIASHYPGSDYVNQAIKNNGDNAFGKIPTNGGKYELSETKYVCGLIISEDGQTVEDWVILPCTSTKLGPLKKWYTSMCKAKVGNAPLFAFRSVIRTVLQKNKKGKDSFNITVTPFGGIGWKECIVDPTQEWGIKILEAGKMMLDAIETGKISVDFQSISESEQEDEGSAGGSAPSADSGEAPY